MWRFSFTFRGDCWHAIKPTAEIVHKPGSGVIRRTGRFFYPVTIAGKIVRRYCEPPPTATAVAPEVDDEWPF